MVLGSDEPERKILECSVPVSPPLASKLGDNGRNQPTPLSPKLQTPFSPVVNVSKMQASFAERTAADMREIVNWYEKYEGIERMKKQNQQSQSMPDNALVGTDDDKNESFGEASEIGDDDDKENQVPTIEVRSTEFGPIKYCSTPAQKEEIRKSTSSTKKSSSSLYSATSIAQKYDDPPPSAIKIKSKEEDKLSISPLKIRDESNKMKQLNDAAEEDTTGNVIHDHHNKLESLPFNDEEEKVLAILSPDFTKFKAMPVIENASDYRDEEEEVLALLSPNCSGGTSDIGNRIVKPTYSKRSGSMDCNSTEKIAQKQIDDARTLIHNTNEMAEIVSQLQQLSSSFNIDDSDNDDNSFSICTTNENADSCSVNINARLETKEIENTPSSSTRTSSTDQHSASEKRNANELCFADVQVQQLHQFVWPILLSLVIGFLMKYINT